MKNSVNARVSFSFKGVEYNPSMTIDLDEVMRASNGLPNLYSILARKNDIDTYSYLYEVMEASELIFDEPTGLAEQCVNNGEFDMQQFEKLWRDDIELEVLQKIASKHLGAESLAQLPGLKEALLEAYRLGKAEGK